MKNIAMTLVSAAIAAGWLNGVAAVGQEMKAVSADGRNVIRLAVDPVRYEVIRDGKVIVPATEIGMRVNNNCVLKGEKVKGVTATAVNGVFDSPVYKKGKVDCSRNETLVDFGDWRIRLAARNDGVAYRFETVRGGWAAVNCEKAGLKLAPETQCWLGYTGNSGSEETVYQTPLAKDIASSDKEVVYLPFVFKADKTFVAFTESDVCDYPILNLSRTETNKADVVTLSSSFTRWPKKTQRVGGWGEQIVQEGGRWVRILEQSNDLVSFNTERTFPWRCFIIADEPSAFAEADLVWALAREPKAGYDFSWVKPGKVAWDWWNCFDNKRIPENEGVNTKTYERFIDFAQKTGVEYVIFDEGWSESLNIWKYHPSVDVDHLVKYANERGVGIILWMAWAQVFGCEEKVAEHFGKLGVKGFKVDFMDRGDAEVERFLWKFADECAKRKLIVDYHGAHRPTGMSRAYPNVVNYEGVHGLEQMKWGKKDSRHFMDNDVRVCFLRMTAGPMDYTPGAMDNWPVTEYTSDNGKNPGSAGTRCRQMAMMALYEAPLQMLCDAPTKYEANMESFKFMAATPVVWDDTVALGGCPDSYFALARKAKDGSWYAGAMTDRNARDITIDTAKFLKSGEWKMEIFRDDPNGDKEPRKYVHETKTVKAGEKLTFHCCQGGAFIARFVK